ncbi:hypothetical protein TUM4438_18720 [Shewanella sairae]|uniref:DUF333 domain-containing protein n=1 Tax=Shewanella sairae TaxID=190310 RepID=A0ABQ4PCV5_9GAMM|nr:DUF333 domain-containing protein [Shewanella sairae]MCL1131043.1 DUF333 domain-containing protein [Shewanella sairae]GIU45382.1 hypothetical protein TUM4438_18720 [Shewanella sairae]
MNQINFTLHQLKIITVTAGALLLSACNPATENTPPTTQLTNPASTYCVSLGGKVDIEKQAEGEVGYCSLPSGERIEEWTLYRKDHPQRTEAATTSVEHKPQVGLPNPATKNCIEQGGTVDLTTSICTLPSGEQIEQWQLYRRDKDAAQ